MEAARTSETSVDNYFTRQYIPEDNSEHHTRRRENLKSHTKLRRTEEKNDKKTQKFVGGRVERSLWNVAVKGLMMRVCLRCVTTTEIRARHNWKSAY